jgi:L-malate glycosyltransferase
VKVGIYNEPSGGAIGGAESSVAILAEALGSRHEVEIVHHRRELTMEKLAEVSGSDLGAVRLRYVEAQPHAFGNSRIPWKRFRDARNWHANLSTPYDLFVNFTHRIPPFCHAPFGILMVLFPLDERPQGQALTASAATNVSPLKRRAKSLYNNLEWQKRFDSYKIKTANSCFTQQWTRRRWGIDCQVVYPPVDTDFGATAKSNLILSVGRFASEGHSKKQLEMMTAFKEMRAESFSGWQYLSAGSLGDEPIDRAYFESVERAGEGCGAKVIANLERARLKSIFAEARIFWHAAGYGEDEERPELSEHFGMVTAEAMAAGCVPVVINKGGQSEIVEHAVNGFLWDTLEELKHYTLLLSGDEQLRSRMARVARLRAQRFSRDLFRSDFLRLVSSYL